MKNFTTYKTILDELVIQCRNELVTFALKYYKNKSDAENAVHEIYFKLVIKDEDYIGTIENLKNYFKKCIVNLYFDEMREKAHLNQILNIDNIAEVGGKEIEKDLAILDEINSLIEEKKIPLMKNEFELWCMINARFKRKEIAKFYNVSDARICKRAKSLMQKIKCYYYKLH